MSFGGLGASGDSVARASVAALDGMLAALDDTAKFVRCVRQTRPHNGTISGFSGVGGFESHFDGRAVLAQLRHNGTL